MSDVILVLDCGSSSLKFAVYEIEAASARLVRLAYGKADGLGARPRFVAFDAQGQSLGNAALSFSDHTATQEDALNCVLTWLRDHNDGSYRLVAIGHRVVHGGTAFSAPVRVDAQVLTHLDAFSALAPLHQPPALAAIHLLLQRLPEILQVACFDTAFHRSQTEIAQAYALPRELRDEGIRRYGFHGLSYHYIASVLPKYLGEQADGKVVVAHLGAGASLCAMLNRQSVASTMGFTALDGLMMGSRCGSLDPGVVLYLITQKGMTAEQVSNLLYQRSGLLGVSGLSSDVRELTASDSPAAKEAIELFVYRIARELGSLVAALGGLDAIVFTAGIGENSADVRQGVCALSQWLGIELDDQANQAHCTRISDPASRVSVWVIPTDEESVIADAAMAILRSPAVAPAPGDLKME